MTESPLPISFLSDYGYDDEFAGVCRGVIVAAAPGATIVDLTHGIASGDVRRGALALADAVPSLPPGVHLAVVDPRVGTTRRPIAVRAAAAERIFVGPDNGLLWPAIEGCGGALEAVDVGESRFRAAEVSATFHGRDLFAPVAAQLALGADLAACGAGIDPGSLARPPMPQPIVAEDHAVAHLLYVDHFGNAVLDLGSADFRTVFGEASEVEVGLGGGRRRAQVAVAFGDVAPGELLVYEDSNGRIALAVNRGHAADDLGLAPDDQVLLQPPP